MKKIDSDTLRVSVVVPNYNYARFLPKRISSILSQGFPIYELIILDDASTDNSNQVIKQILNGIRIKYPDLKCYYIKNRKNSGNVFRQWNKAFAKASGDYLWIAEADDLAQPTFLENVMRNFRKDTQVVLSYSESSLIDETGSELLPNLRSWSGYKSHLHWCRNYVNNGTKELTRFLAVNNTIINASSVVFKLDRNIPFAKYLDAACNFQLAGDWYFYAHILMHGKIAYVKEPLNCHREHTGSVTSITNRADHFREIIAMQNEVARLVKLPFLTKRLIAKHRAELRKKWHLTDERLPSVFKEPLVTIVVPVYNLEDCVEACLESILKQEYKNFEVILVNDGSTDGSLQILKTYAQKDPRFHIISQQNAGLSVARNAGLRQARGEFIAFVDGDDHLDPLYLFSLLSAMNDDKDIAVCGYFEELSLSHPTSSLRKVLPPSAGLSGIDAVSRLLIRQENYDLVAWNKLYRTELFRKNHIEYPEGRLYEDCLTTYKLYACAKEVAFIREALYYYVRRNGSITTTNTLLKSLSAREEAAREASAYFSEQIEEVAPHSSSNRRYHDAVRLLTSAKISLLTANFAYLDHALAGRIPKKHGRAALAWIRKHHAEYWNNPALTFKLRLYLMLIKTKNSNLYLALRRGELSSDCS